MSSEVHMKMAPPEALAKPSFYGPPQQHHHPGYGVVQKLPLTAQQAKSRRRLTVWSSITLGYSIINVGAAIAAVMAAIAVVFGGLLAAYVWGDAGMIVSLVVGALFLLWLVSIPASAVIGLICAIRAGGLHKRLVPLGHGAAVPRALGWIAFGISTSITLILVIQAFTLGRSFFA